MKKTILALAVLAFLGVSATSCKSKKHCEAYGTTMAEPQPKANS